MEFEENRNVWVPYYSLQKIIQGLIDSHTYLGNQKTLTLAVNLTHYINRRFEKLSFWKIDGILSCTKVNPVNEFGGIVDVLYTMYDITGDDNYHQPMGSCVYKKFSGLYDSFWCCTASGIEAMSELQQTHDRLAFVVEDEQGNEVKFIPLFRIEKEKYSVYWDWTGNSLQSSRFSFAKDGSTAYEEA